MNFQESITLYREIVSQAGQLFFRYPAFRKVILSFIWHTKVFFVIKNAEPNCVWPIEIWKMAENNLKIHYK